MRKAMFLLGTLVLLLPVLFINCNVEDPPAQKGKIEVKLTYNQGAAFLSDAEVNLYKSMADQSNGKEYLSETTSEKTNGICYFENLAPGIYYVEAEGADNSIVYSALDSVQVFAGKQAKLTLSLTSFGDLEVFVRQGTIAGPFITNAVVEVYLSEEDRTNGITYRSAVTPFDPVLVTTEGAFFDGMPDGTYYISAFFSLAGGDYIGYEQASVTKGKKTVIHVACVK